MLPTHRTKGANPGSVRPDGASSPAATRKNESSAAENRGGAVGKALLWMALQHSLAGSPVVEWSDPKRLQERAAHQLARVETLRLECAGRALKVQAP